MTNELRDKGKNLSDIIPENFKTPYVGVDDAEPRLSLSGAPMPPDGIEGCAACGAPFKPGDMVIDDITEGTMHRDCAGSDRESFVDPVTEEPIGPDEPLPTGYPWQPDAATGDEDEPEADLPRIDRIDRQMLEHGGVDSVDMEWMAAMTRTAIAPAATGGSVGNGGLREALVRLSSLEPLGGSGTDYDELAARVKFARNALAQPAPVGEDETGVREGLGRALKACERVRYGGYLGTPTDCMREVQKEIDKLSAPQPPKAETPVGVEDRTDWIKHGAVTEMADAAFAVDATAPSEAQINRLHTAAERLLDLRAALATITPAAPKTPDAATGGSVGENQKCPSPHRYDRGECCGGHCPAPVGEDETGVREALKKAVSDVLYKNQFEEDWRELVDPVVDAILPLAPQPPKAETPAGVGYREREIEAVAEHLHEEREYDRQWTWPTHENDDGYRGNGHVTITPPDVQAHLRDEARRILIRVDQLRRPAALSTAPAARPEDEAGPLAEIAAERRRQIEAEGWTPEHDDTHASGEMALAAGCYALAAAGNPYSWLSQFWPWSRDWWKPSVPRRNLVKSGALIVAEIERLDRAALAAAPAADGGRA